MSNPTGPARTSEVPAQGPSVPAAAVPPLAQADGDSGQGPAFDAEEEAVLEAQRIGRW